MSEQNLTGNPLWLRAKALKLYGVMEHWGESSNDLWLPTLLQWEEEARTHRGLERRLSQAKLGRFKSLSDFDWTWPTECDRELVEELMHLEFLKSATNPILLGPNGVGKTTIACNIAYQAAMKGHSVLFIQAGQMLSDLAAQDGGIAFRRRLQHYEKQTLLVIDELGYMAYSNRYADLLFEVVSRRYQKKSTIITTNKPFNEWGEIFANASCVVSLVDRLIHHSEIIQIEAPSFRLKDHQEGSKKKKQSKEPKKHSPKKEG